jgi:MerR family transcriptional regulator, thiopeptide resistance regulator
MYTVRELSKLAGVTRRTLHYYDQIGLLAPSQVAENGYRYYSRDALLRLQQILLYRELDMPLDQIKYILDGPGFDILDALEGHRAHLQQRITRLERMVETVDNTIKVLKGVENMEEKNLFTDFSEEQQATYEQEAMQMYDPDIVKASNQRWKRYSAEEKQRILDEGKQVYLDFLKAMPAGPASSEARAAVEHWRRHMHHFWTPNEAQLLGLSHGYIADPRFKATFDELDPKLAEFICDAVAAYLNQS